MDLDVSGDERVAFDRNSTARTRPDAMTEIEGFILVGGASSRMGQDKARLHLEESTFVERIAGAVASIAARVSIVGAKGSDGGDWSLPCVTDVYPAWGALGGLHAALAACRARWAAVVACDLPFVSGEMFARLADLSGDHDAVVPVQPDGRRQPLCALYRTEPCRERAQELILAGERRPRALLSRIRTRFVAPEEMADLDGSSLFFMNVNTPEDFALARESVGQQSRAERG
jgi:molybdopterin-guanine dinucleotide biosynthesis protein A